MKKLLIILSLVIISYNIKATTIHTDAVDVTTAYYIDGVNINTLWGGSGTSDSSWVSMESGIGNIDTLNVTDQFYFEASDTATGDTLGAWFLNGLMYTVHASKPASWALNYPLEPLWLKYIKVKFNKIKEFNWIFKDSNGNIQNRHKLDPLTTTSNQQLQVQIEFLYRYLVRTHLIMLLMFIFFIYLYKRK